MTESVQSGEDNKTRYREVFNTTIGDTISQAIRIIGSDPSLLIPGTGILNHQRKAAAVRRRHERNGLIVPPIMIISITSRCNLTCAGCYMQGREHTLVPEMSPEILSSVINQAAELGISIIVIAGGEPLVRYEEILQIAKKHHRVLFPVFSNGLMIHEKMASAFASCRNIVPVISFEGFREETDTRRGNGVYDRLLVIGNLLKEQNIFFGCSVTTTRKNFENVTSEPFIKEMIDTGVRVFAFVEYVPMTPETEDDVLTLELKEDLQIILNEYNRRFPALFLSFPGDEAVYGGCLAAGRGFVHVSPSGNLEPCPAVTYSDTNLSSVPLKEALQSLLLKRIREEPEVLTESSGGCALRANQAYLQEIMNRK